MKTVLIFLASVSLVFADPSGCRSPAPAQGTAAAPPQGGGTAAPAPAPAPAPPLPPQPITITLSPDAVNPEIGPNQKLDFYLPDAVAGDTYFVKFLNRNPCTGAGEGPLKTYRGSYATHPSCVTKARASTNTTYTYTWQKNGVPGRDMPVPFNSFPCHEC